jgi:hypothetical protein
MVRPTLSCDVQFLEQEFACRYCYGAVVFYVSTTNEAGETSKFTAEEMDEWDPLWKEKNATFEEYVDLQPALKFLKNLKFFLCDGNHRRLAWMNVISRMYSTNPKWHYVVDCILLDTKGKIEIVMQVMHDINKWVH